MAPGDGLVISTVVLKVAVKDPHQAVPERPKSSVMGVPGLSVGVVEGARPW
jgi:hypothetical protein